MTLAQLVDVSAQVQLGNGDMLTTVDHVSLTLCEKTSYALIGKSGSGKTSLASIIGLLNNNYRGTFIYQNNNISKLSDKERSILRSQSIGFVFQNYSLIKHLNVYENIELALMYLPSPPNARTRRKRIHNILQCVNLEHKIHEYPQHLSGGEQQRVAIARALIRYPQLLICDEPTGALDSITSEQIMSLLYSIVAEYNSTLLLVTHDPDIATSCDYQITMEQGRISHAPNAD